MERQKTKGKIKPELRVLILEDDPADAELMERQLRREKIGFAAQRAESRSGFIKALDGFRPDVILADYKLPKFDALRALELRNKMAPQTPFIIITGTISEETAVECMKQGADDYLLKDRLARLAQAVRHALEKHDLQKEKARVEATLRADELIYHTFIDANTDMAFLKDDKFRHLLANRELCRFYGKAEHEILGLTDFELMDEEAAARCRLSDKQALAGNRIHISEETIGRRVFETRKFPVKLSDNRIGVGGYIRDISDRQQAEAALRDSEERFRGLYENTTIGMYRTTPDGRIVLANPALIRMLGYSAFADLTKRDLEKGGFEPAYARHYFREQLEKNGQVIGLESAWLKRDGTTIYVRESAISIRAENGDILYYDGTVEDISGRKQAERSLREVNEIFQMFLKHNPIYVFIKDENIRPIYLSENYEKMLGRPLQEILGKSMEELFPSALSRSMVEDDREILGEGVPREFIEKLNGRTYSTLKFPIMIQGKAKFLAGYTMDITEREKIEAALKESENRYRNHFENSSEFYFTLDLKGNFTEVNKAAVALTGHSKSELLRMNFKDYTPRRDHRKLFLALATVFKTGEPCQNLQIEAIMKDKSIKFFETNFSLLKDGEQVIGFQGSSKDVTERKRDEDLIHASLREKEVLLKEIHHRVKNNLQVISGLLTLQSAQMNDERLQRMIKESQGRIWTMALIHQTLYQSGNLADIDMADYIRSLCGNLLSSYSQVAMPPTVKFDLLPVHLVIDKAIPLALIINELVVNAIKHAFPDGRPGEIRISLLECRNRPRPVPADHTSTARVSLKDTDATPKEGTARCAPTHELIVADNGVGLPEGFDPGKQQSLGLQLVSMLAKQLGGTLVIGSSGGASVAISFANDEKN